MKGKELTLRLPASVRALWTAQQALARRYADTGLKFTLDGRLVGDIAEALAREHFGLVPPPKRTGGVDALTADRKTTVQVKATGLDDSGPAFTPGVGKADHLLFVRINFKANTASVAYNGPESPIRALLPKGVWTGTREIRLADVQRLAKKVAIKDRLKCKKK